MACPAGKLCVQSLIKVSSHNRYSGAGAELVSNCKHSCTHTTTQLHTFLTERQGSGAAVEASGIVVGLPPLADVHRRQLQRPKVHCAVPLQQLPPIKRLPLLPLPSPLLLPLLLARARA